MTHWKLTLGHPTQVNLDLDTLMSPAQSTRILLLIGTVSTVAASTLLHVLNAIDAMLLILLLLILFKVTLNERHQVPASSNLPSQVQTTEDILLIGCVRAASTSTLLDARSAIGAVSPGDLVDLRAIAV